MTRRELVTVAALAALNTDRPVGIPVTRRVRGFDQPKSEALAISLRQFKEEIDKGPGPAGGGISKRALILAIDCRAQGSSSATPEQVLDPALEWVTRKLGGSRLGGLVFSTLEVEIRWDDEQADHAYARATVYVVCRYETLVADATVGP